MILIAGGGVAGLSAAHHLQALGTQYMLLEKAATVGGLCRSMRTRGYTFDWSGHLFCPREPWVASWVEELLEGKLRWFERDSSVYVKGAWVPVPLQAHLGFLPKKDTLECLAAFLLEKTKVEAPDRERPWPDWIKRTFGEGMSKLFFFPYHEKLWGTPLDQLSVDGMEWSVPRPTIQEVVDGALGHRNPLMGYNALLCYPSNAGIEDIPNAIARDLTGVHRLARLEKVFWREKIAVVRGLGKIRYRKLISTIPLSALVRILEPPLGEEGLHPTPKAISIWVLNIGVMRPSASHYHWVYFPERELPFFRIGCYTAFAPHLAPSDRSSFYVEIPCHGVAGETKEQMVKRALNAMVKCGILRNLSEVEIVVPIKIPIAYVIHDLSRTRWLPRVLALLASQDIRCVGRYGAWGYGTMEQAIIQGQEAAQWALEE